MRCRFPRIILCASVALLTGCSGGGLTPNQKSDANRQWNEARANVLASLATDQYKDGSLEKCQETLDQALSLEPNNPNLHLLQAKLAIEQGKLDVAENQLNEVSRLDPKDAEANYLTGVVQQRWNQLAKAREAYARASERDPTEVSYPLAEAEMLVAQSDPMAALSLLQLKVKLFEHSAVIHDAIGQLLIQQKQYTLGITELRQGCILAMDDCTIHEHLAFALLADARYPESADVFQELLRDPAYEKRADIHAALADSLTHDHRLADAKHHFQLATQLNPDGIVYWLGLTRVLSQLDDYFNAEVAARHAVSIDSSNCGAQYLLGYARLKQNKLAESLAAFRAAAQSNPQDSMCICLQGYVLCRMGHKSEGQTLYARALELDPSNELVNQLNSRLDR